MTEGQHWMQTEVPDCHGLALMLLVIVVTAGVPAVLFPLVGAPGTTKEASYVLGVIVGIGGWQIAMGILERVTRRFYME